MGKKLPAKAGDLRDTDLIPGLGRSSGVGNDNHSSIHAWRIPWTEEPSGLPPIGTPLKWCLAQHSTVSILKYQSY